MEAQDDERQPGRVARHRDAAAGDLVRGDGEAVQSGRADATVERKAEAAQALARRKRTRATPGRCSSACWSAAASATRRATARSTPTRRSSGTVSGALLGHVAPEVGYWLEAGPDAVAAGAVPAGHRDDRVLAGRPAQHDPVPAALAVFAKATLAYVDRAAACARSFRAASGGGQIRHVVTFGNLNDCGPSGSQTCKDSVVGGPLLAEVGGGFFYKLSDSVGASLVEQRPGRRAQVHAERRLQRRRRLRVLNHETLSRRRFPARQQDRRRSVPEVRAAAADHRLPLPPAAASGRRRPQWRSITEIWLDGRPLQVARDAHGRRPRAQHHRRRVRLGEVRGLGGDGAADAAQPALPLDAPRAAFPFGVQGKLLGPDTATRDLRALQPAARPRRRSRRRGCCAQYDVQVVCSTDDPVDDLEPHRRHAKNAEGAHQALPDLASRQGAGRPRPRRSGTAGSTSWAPRRTCPSTSWPTLREALQKRHDFFHAAGCRASDHGLERHLRGAVHRARGRGDLRQGARAARRCRPSEIEKFRSALLYDFAVMDHAARLGAAVPPGRHAQQQHARDARRSGPTPATTPSATSRRARRWRASSIAWTARTAGEDDPLQPEPARQRAVADDHRQLPGRLGRPGRCSSAAPGGSSTSSTAWRSR